MRRRDDTKVEQLARLELFEHCSRRDLQLVARVADEVTVEAGKVLCRQGRVGRECYVIIEGEAEVVVGGRHVASVGPGESVGEMSLFDRRPQSATVVAVTPVRAYEIPGHRFTSLIVDSPSVAVGVMRSMSRRIRALDMVPTVDLATT